MRVSEAVTGVGAGAIWISFTVIMVTYALIAWAFVGTLLRMRLRWRREDAARAEASSPETEVPYGPRGDSIYVAPDSDRPHGRAPADSDDRGREDHP